MAGSCQNPLLAGWLKEKWDVARERGSKGALVYKKAYQSMEKCPLKFKHPSEAQNLQGIGPKLADWLTDKLREHCDQNGLPMPTKGRKDARRRSELAELGETTQEQSPEPPAKKARKAKEYVPALRSGAYAIIKALSLIPDVNRGLSKNDLVREAQPYADSSFTVPSATNKMYTAWKSIDTLLKKELVCITGKPVSRYYLSDDGLDVAKKIKAVETDMVLPAQKGVQRPLTSATKEAVSGLVASPGRDRSINEKRLIAIEKRMEIESAIVASLKGNKYAAAVSEIVQDAVAPKRKISQSAQASTKTRAPTTNREDASRKLPTLEITDLTSSREPSPARVRLVSNQPNSPEPRINDLIRQFSGADQSRLTSDKALVEQGQTSTVPHFEPIVLPPGSFQIRLVLDNREVRSVADRDYISLELQKHSIVPIIRPLELGDALWIAEIKPPHNEGFLALNPDDEGDGRKEIVLDYIMERKRLDDLLFSIKDGRFHEQKFRLRKSGVKNIIYLVEEYSISSEREGKYGEALESAIAGMQIINGFFVKQTTNLDETVSYLASMTKTLKDIYEKQELRVIPSRMLDSRKYALMIGKLREKDPEINNYITFAAFNLMCTKSDSLTLRDVYLKMLMCTRGVTGEKAMEIQKKWPTPRALFEAYESANSAKAKETLVSDQLGGLISRKKVAKGLSAKIAGVWA